MVVVEMRDAVCALPRFLNSGGATAGAVLGPPSEELIAAAVNQVWVCVDEMVLVMLKEEGERLITIAFGEHFLDLFVS